MGGALPESATEAAVTDKTTMTLAPDLCRAAPKLRNSSLRR